MGNQIPLLGEKQREIWFIFVCGFLLLLFVISLLFLHPPFLPDKKGIRIPLLGKKLSALLLFEGGGAGLGRIRVGRVCARLAVSANGICSHP